MNQNAAKSAPQERVRCTRRKEGSPGAKGSHAGHAADRPSRQPASFEIALPRRAGRRGLEVRDGAQDAQGRAQALPELPQVAFR